MEGLSHTSPELDSLEWNGKVCKMLTTDIKQTGTNVTPFYVSWRSGKINIKRRGKIFLFSKASFKVFSESYRVEIKPLI